MPEKEIKSLLLTPFLQPDLLFTCTLKGLSPALRQERSMFIRAAQAIAKLAPLHGPSEQVPPRPSNAINASTTAETGDLRNALQIQKLVSSHVHLQVECYSGKEESTSGRKISQYLVAQGCSGVGTPAWQLATEVSKQLGTNLVPWAAVALPLLPQTSGNGEFSTSQEQQGGFIEEGLMFCCLPLPAVSGLPAHVNGTFELSSNRRDLWHGSDLVGVGRQVRNSQICIYITIPIKC